MEQILKNWNILIEGMGPHSFDAIEIEYAKWKIALLNTVSEPTGMTMLESAARNNNMRAFSFIFNEMRLAQMPDDHTLKALEYALYYGNYNIARALLTRKNLLFRISQPFESPVYREDAHYHRMKMNALLREFHDTTQIEPTRTALEISEAPEPPPSTDISIDLDGMPWIHWYFADIILHKVIKIEDISVYNRFYYKRYTLVADALQLEYVYTTLLIESLEAENMPMVNLLIENRIIHRDDINYLEEQIAESRLYDTRMMLYKEIYERISKK